MTAPARSVVVVGVDGSTGSRDAVRWAAGYARLAGAELRAVASWRWPNYLTRIPPEARLMLVNDYDHLVSMGRLFGERRSDVGVRAYHCVPQCVRGCRPAYVAS